MALGSENSNIKDNKNQIFDSKFELIESIGRGRNSIVYKAKKLDSNSQSEIAIKILPIREDAEECVSRMKREALVMLSCIHENVIKLHDFVAKDQYCYITMELAESGDLKNLLLQRNDALKLDLALDFIIQTLKGLSLIHKKGILHRDIKPENILLVNNHIVKIADFSIALTPLDMKGANGLAHSQAIGTFDYIAPEILNGSVSSIRSDLYSVGITLYQLLTNKMPFDAKSLADQINAKVAADFIPVTELNPELPWQLDKVIQKVLTSDPEHRFKDSAEFIQELELIRNQRAMASDLINNNVANKNYDTGRYLNNWIIEESPAVGTEVCDEEIAPKINTTEKKSKKLKKKNLSVNPKIATYTSRILLATSLLVGVLFGVSYASAKYKRANVNKTLINKTESVKIITNNSALENADVDLLTLKKLFKTPVNGVFQKINLDGTDIKFATMPIENENNKIMIQLSLIKWEPMAIDLSELAKNKSIVVDQLGLKIKIELGNNNNLDVNSFGKYTEINSGRSGSILLDL
ncbi:MAG: serine/threonine protein kinase [Proteobacteria bacterium]|nr:serine/threonine protein kinase [Pseudomonadota bacterium]